jgi:septum formation topological specificity factor MinE
VKQLERLLLFQGNRCFFCHEFIPPGEASVEHLVATANGGAKDDENCVVCCKTINAALGSLSIKAKLQVVVNQRGIFVCPQSRGAESVAHATEHLAEPEDERLQLVVADLQKRGSARPRRLATLKNTISAMFQKKLTEEQLSFLAAALEARGYVTVQDNKVTYALPQPDA